MSSLISSEKCLKFQGTTKFMVVDKNLPNYSFSFDSSYFITVTVSCFFSKCQVHFILLIFKDMSAQYLSLKNHSLSIINFLIQSLLYFFHYYLVPLHPTLPSNHHTVIYVHESFLLFPFCSIPPLAAILLSIYESVHIFPVSSLDSTYE